MKNRIRCSSYFRIWLDGITRKKSAFVIRRSSPTFRICSRSSATPINCSRSATPSDRPLDDVGEMLLESDPVYGPAPSFDRERQVRKHIGDFTLFFAGMFPESINHFRLRRQRLENFVDWVKAGKESYYIVSKFEHFEYAKVAPLFASLSKNFEGCVYGLNMVKNDLEEMQHPDRSPHRRPDYVDALRSAAIPANPAVFPIR